MFSLPSALLTKSFSALTKTTQRFLKMDSFVWIDMELTGLDITKDTVLEIACIITDPQLKFVHEGIHLIIHQPEDVLNSMNEWSLQQHAKTNLTESSRKSNVSLPNADEQVAKYIAHHSKGTRFLSGNSVYMDKMFLMKYLPQTHSLLHYRIIDVSSIKILCSNWYPEKFQQLSNKKVVHRALDDIKQSIEELKNYRELIFK